MSKIVIGAAKLTYDTDGDLQIGVFQPMINVTKEQIKNSELGKCSNKTAEEIRQCAELLLATFFNKVSEIELRDIEKTELQSSITKEVVRLDGSIAEIEIEFALTEKAL